MRTGVSLPLPFLADRYTEQGSMELKKQGHTSGSLLAKLKENGTDSIELRYWQKDMEPETIYSVFEKIRNSGLGLTIHGDISEKQENVPITESFPWLEKAIEISGSDNKNPLVITMHPVKTESRTKEGNYKKTVSILRHICAGIEERELPVVIAYENQRERGGPNPAIDYSEITGVVKETESSAIGICWDMGHAWANFRRDLINEDPTEEFVNKTIHTHIHDLPPERISTHWPLVYGTVPVERYVRMLGNSGYNGILNLELSPEKFPDMDILGVFVKSIELLKNWAENS